MRKNEVNAILINQTKRRNNVFNLIFGIVIVFAISFAFLFIYLKRSEKHYVTYDETSNIEYKVYLKENNFFEDNYLDANKQYIASLIDYIDSNFIYKLSLDEKDVEYKYSYRIEAVVDVKEKNSNDKMTS